MATSRALRTAKKREAFLAELARRGNVSDACRAVDAPRQTMYDWRETDPAFAAAWDAALDEAADRMEREAFRRAVEGVDEPVFYQGDEVGSVRKYSDTLLIFLLKAARPEKYRERTEVQASGALRIEYVNDWRNPND